ncbi:uncharacterized protein BDV17DRAFT_293897 [Aspergillus undulatus]|uniref:uncharacterized protein n=1 Tax=Aspergillus undulatus TaxID=1810928 RepID=UPI003CCCC23E
MSNRAERTAEDAYERQNDPSFDDNISDNTYAYQTGNQGFSMGIPVQRDNDSYEDPMQPPYSNSQQQLEQDEREALNEGNMLNEPGKGRTTRRNKPQATGYSEGLDEEDLPNEAFDTGRSSTKRVY